MTKEEAIDLLDNLIGMVEDNHNSNYDTALQMAIKALEPEPCDVFDEYGNYKYPSDVELTEPNTATSMPCDDAISRQAVLEQTYNWSKDEFLRVTNPFYYLRKRINSLPPVTPQPKTGRWIKSKDGYMRCDKCGSRGSAIKARFCHHCGAKMERDEQDADID